MGSTSLVPKKKLTLKRDDTRTIDERLPIKNINLTVTLAMAEPNEHYELRGLLKELHLDGTAVVQLGREAVEVPKDKWAGMYLGHEIEYVSRQFYELPRNTAYGGIWSGKSIQASFREADSAIGQASGATVTPAEMIRYWQKLGDEKALAINYTWSSEWARKKRNGTESAFELVLTDLIEAKRAAKRRFDELPPEQQKLIRKAGQITKEFVASLGQALADEAKRRKRESSEGGL